jgi:hypothetical protein
MLDIVLARLLAKHMRGRRSRKPRPHPCRSEAPHTLSVEPLEGRCLPSSVFPSDAFVSPGNTVFQGILYRPPIVATQGIMPSLNVAQAVLDKPPGSGSPGGFAPGGPPLNADLTLVPSLTQPPLAPAVFTLANLSPMLDRDILGTLFQARNPIYPEGSQSLVVNHSGKAMPATKFGVLIPQQPVNQQHPDGRNFSSSNSMAIVLTGGDQHDVYSRAI